MKKKCINFGSGKNYVSDNEMEELINLDINDDWKVDVTWNLEKIYYPFKTSAFDIVKVNNI